jgi:hypothetical protein
MNENWVENGITWEDGWTRITLLNYLELCLRGLPIVFNIYILVFSTKSSVEGCRLKNSCISICFLVYQRVILTHNRYS